MFTLEDYSNPDINIATQMYMETLGYYRQKMHSLYSGKLTRARGTAASTFQPVVVNILNSVRQLEKHPPGVGDRELIAFHHWRISNACLNKHEVDLNMPTWMWDMETRRPERVLSIESEYEDGRKLYFARLQNSTPVYLNGSAFYSKFRPAGMAELEEIPLKAIPVDWSLKLRQLEAKSVRDGFMWAGIPAKSYSSEPAPENSSDNILRFNPRSQC